jgi:hypothetical protein
VLVGVLGTQSGAATSRNLRAGALPISTRSRTQTHAGQVVRSRAQLGETHAGREVGGTPATTIGPVETESYSCPPATGPDGTQLGTRQLVSGHAGLVLTASTFCRSSTWYVSERMAGATTVDATPFRVPDDPPIPPSVSAERFVPVVRGALPAVLVQREQFGNASLYELFTVAGRSVEPMSLTPGGSPALFLKATSLLEGAGFECSDAPSGEVIRQYEWYIENPTTLQTGAHGEVIGNPAVFLQTTVYTANSPDTFLSATLPTVSIGYRAAAAFDQDAC